jgi:hypothetical protein
VRFIDQYSLRHLLQPCRFLQRRYQADIADGLGKLVVRKFRRIVKESLNVQPISTCIAITTASIIDVPTAQPTKNGL